MRIIDLVNKMGGVKNVLGQSFQPIPRTDLARLFEVNDPNFSDYIDYLEYFGGATTFKDIYEPTPYNECPEYCYPEETGIYNPPYSGINLGVIYGEGSKCPKEFSISNDLMIFGDRIPKGFLPIANDIFGCLYLLKVEGVKKGYIYFWDSNNDPDPDEYFEIHGEEMLDEVKMQNMYCVGKNFYDFINRMIYSPDNNQ